MDPVDAFRAEDAAVAVVGAGGKKTTMYALADRLNRAVLTATVRIPIFDPHVDTVAVTEEPITALDAATADRFPLGLVPAQERDDRYVGYERPIVDELIAAHDGAVLIKADGARMRSFKAPATNEPRIPGRVDVVVPVASAGVVGEPLDEELVHRPERVAAVGRDAGLDVAVGDPVTPELVGAVLAADDGGLKDVPDGAAAVPLVNQVDRVDDAVAEAVADAFHRRLAERADAGADVPDVPHVVLASMAEDRIVKTV